MEKKKGGGGNNSKEETRPDSVFECVYECCVGLTWQARVSSC